MTPARRTPVPARSAVLAHPDELSGTLAGLRDHAPALTHRGRELVRRLRTGGRLLAAGNGATPPRPNISPWSWSAGSPTTGSCSRRSP